MKRSKAKFYVSGLNPLTNEREVISGNMPMDAAIAAAMRNRTHTSITIHIANDGQGILTL